MSNSNQFRIATPTVMLNDIPFAVVNDSVEMTEGHGEVTVEGASAGGGNRVQVLARDVSSAFGMLKFSVHTTLENHEILSRLMEPSNDGNISVSITSTNTSTGKTFSRAATGHSITNNPAVKFGTSGQFDIELKGGRFI